MSNSSLSSFFSASPGTRDSVASLSGDSLIAGSSVNLSGSSASDTIRDSASTTPTPSLGSTSEILLISSTVSNLSNILSISLSLNTVESCQSRASIIAVPPCPVKASKTRVQTLVDLESSPFVRRRKFTVSFPDEHEPKPVIATPTPARLRSLMKEKLYIGGWINKVDRGYIPEHIPWEFEEDEFAPMPWIPEGSIVSKNRFFEVRREQRPKSYSPPPTPLAGHDLPLDALPFPAIIPSPTEGPTLKKAVSFHPGGSQRLRREALVIDGKVTIDTGFNFRSRSRESIVPSSSEPNNVDLIVRQLDAEHQSGLERLKNSMLRLMKVQSLRRYSAAPKEGKRSELSFSTMAPNKTKDKIAEGISHEPLAVRRGLTVPSTLKLVSTRPLPLVSPYHPDIPTPFRGSLSAATPSFEVTGFSLASAADKRESVDVEDMCTTLRSLVSPTILNPASKGEVSLSQNSSPATDPGDAVSETPQTPIEDWNFASELEGIYGDDPFSYFDLQERMPSFIRPLSIIPDIVMESAELQRSSGSSATSVSTFPEPPTDTLVLPSIPSIMISGGEPIAENSPAQTRSSFSLSAAASDEDLVYCGDDDEIHTRVIVSSTDTSPRSSEDNDEPLAIRRLTLLARSSTAMLKLEDLCSTGNLPSSLWSCSMSLDQETLKPATKIVRFASETEEHTYLADPEATYSPSKRQRPRSSSVPPPQKGSLRNQTFPQREEYRRDGRLSRSQPITLASRIPKKRTFTGIGLSGRHTVAGKRSAEALAFNGRDKLAQARLENENEGRKRLSSLIPVPGLKASSALSSPDRGKRAPGCNNRLYVSLKQPSRTPTPQSVLPQQKAPLATSWSVTLRQYVRSGDPSGDKRQVPHPPSPRHRGDLSFLPSSPVGTKNNRKSSLPVKKASFFRSGVSKLTPTSGVRDRTEGQGSVVRGDGDIEVNAIGSVDKTGGISYIAPPKVRVTPQSRGRDKGERQGPSAIGTRTLRPVQIKNLLGRLTA
ncbi:hypothetical protein BDM02DRAFT_3123400 [Thelephora ganbajun]|uniref:Uncharacterized protein n=1 Tax=Thelephora ganbajun TaxID=370292 RepID=A0ACB6Z2X1_THEGA|nr:hypothetical protein BDM02DRAFT_3123400 [Thelephora ganbajun]